MNENDNFIRILQAVEEIRGGMIEVKQDIAQIKKDVSSLKEDMRKVLKCVSHENADFQINNH